MVTTDHRSAPRPGGRSARVVEAVHRAATELISETACADGVTIPAVAARAGVNPTTVYRRWGDIDTLLVEVALDVLSEGGPIPDTGDLRTDLYVWTEFLVTDISRPERVLFLRTLVGAMTDEPSNCLDKRVSQIETILANARSRGETTVPSLVDAMNHLIGPIYFRVLFGLGGAGRSDARRLVRELLGG